MDVNERDTNHSKKRDCQDYHLHISNILHRKYKVDINLTLLFLFFYRNISQYEDISCTLLHIWTLLCCLRLNIVVQGYHYDRHQFRSLKSFPGIRIFESADLDNKYCRSQNFVKCGARRSINNANKVKSRLKMFRQKFWTQYEIHLRSYNLLDHLELLR